MRLRCSTWRSGIKKWMTRIAKRRNNKELKMHIGWYVHSQRANILPSKEIQWQQGERKSARLCCIPYIYMCVCIILAVQTICDSFHVFRATASSPPSNSEKENMMWCDLKRWALFSLSYVSSPHYNCLFWCAMVCCFSSLSVFLSVVMRFFFFVSRVVYFLSINALCSDVLKIILRCAP